MYVRSTMYTVLYLELCFHGKQTLSLSSVEMLSQSRDSSMSSELTGHTPTATVSM